MADDNTFSKLSDDVLLIILTNLEDDPRNWARLCCVSKKFSSLISTVCYKSKCMSSLPSISTTTIAAGDGNGDSARWSSLFKLSVCCPGLHLSGILLDHSDFGLHRDLGPYNPIIEPDPNPVQIEADPNPVQVEADPNPVQVEADPNPVQVDDSGCWSLYDDLYYDTIYDNSEAGEETHYDPPQPVEVGPGLGSEWGSGCNKKKRKVMEGRERWKRSHLASGVWGLNREQGDKLLSARFRGDCLYLSDWPGCVHIEEKRSYMLFRGFFKDFKRTKVWRAIKDGNKNGIDLNCAFCKCNETWDLHASFCLKKGFGFHDDGEPVVRAYVCENGHVSGAWTDQPLYA